jgi:exosortase D (VPLPA-CTERM-specific)
MDASARAPAGDMAAGRGGASFGKEREGPRTPARELRAPNAMSMHARSSDARPHAPIRLAVAAAGRETGGGPNWSGIAWLVVAIVAALPVFWFGLDKLGHEWARPEFRLKPLVPFVSLLLFLQVLRSVPRSVAADRTQWVGVLVVAAAILLAIGGNLVDIDDFVFLALVPWIAGLVVTVLGLGRALRFWAPVAVLLLMLPLPHFVVAPIHRYLQSLASELGLGLLRILGIPALAEGRTLDFGVLELPMSEATSGLLDFLPLLLLVFILSTVYRGPLWSRVLPLVLAGPLLVLLSAVRIALLGLFVDRAGAAGGQRLLEWTGDWIVLAISALLLLGIVLGAEHLAGRRQPLLGRLDVDLGDLMSQFARVFRMRASAALVAAAVTSAVLSTIFIADPSVSAPEIERSRFQNFPPEIAGWSGSSTAIGADTERSLDADDYVLIEYRHADEPAPVVFWSAYYRSTAANGRQIHSPEECIPNDGWNILSLRPIELEMGLRGDARMTVNRALISRGSERVLVYYWFEGRGHTTANERVAKLRSKLDGLLRGRTDGALVRFTTPILPGEDESAADARIVRLMEPMLDRLPRFIPD